MGKRVILKAENLIKTYVCPTERISPLNGLNLEVEEGDLVLIYGPSGSGKSTLLNLLAGLDKADSGTLSFLGEHYDNRSDNQLTKMRRNQLGVIFQSFELIPVMSCYDNIEYPLLLQNVPRKERRERVMAMAEVLSISNLLHRKPGKISGGQKQRVAVCRALVGNYKLILGDEITGNLDPRTSEKVYEVLQAMNMQERTFIMVTHNYELKKYANKVFHLLDGVLVKETT